MSLPESAASCRHFLKTAGLASAASLLASQASQGAEQPKAVSQTRAKNIIFLVADGMGNGTLGLAHHWHQRKYGAPLNWTRLFEHPGMTRALQDTASASSPVTDSAAAASAWGCGQRVNNGSVNISTDGQKLTPIMAYARDAGKATGLVTTCRITHATPAGFASNTQSRDDESAILQQYLDGKIDVLLGGGGKFLKGPNFDHYPDFAKAGYQIAKNRSEMEAISDGNRMLGIFAESHVPYRIDRKHQKEHSEVPGLVDMFAKALKHLERAENGYLLQVEAGRVDHAGHANDAGAMLHEMLEFDEAVAFARDYVDSHNDTLLIITTDHGTGGCQLNGNGSKYSESGPALDRMERIQGSFEMLEDVFTSSERFDSALFEKVTRITPTTEQAVQAQALIDAKAKYLNSAMTQLFQAELEAMTSVGWTSNNHTGECVELFAIGPGSELVPPYLKNYELFSIMRQAMRM